jgi:hypothetical protein
LHQRSNIGFSCHLFTSMQFYPGYRFNY